MHWPEEIILAGLGARTSVSELRNIGRIVVRGAVVGLRLERATMRPYEVGPENGTGRLGGAAAVLSW